MSSSINNNTGNGTSYIQPPNRFQFPFFFTHLTSAKSSGRGVDEMPFPQTEPIQFPDCPPSKAAVKKLLIQHMSASFDGAPNSAQEIASGVVVKQKLRNRSGGRRHARAPGVAEIFQVPEALRAEERKNSNDSVSDEEVGTYVDIYGGSTQYE